MNWLKVMTLTTAMTVTSAMAEVAVIVHPSNAATVDQAEITRLFTGRGTTFNNGSKATPLNLAESAPARGEFDSKVLSKSSSQMKAYWSKLVFTGKGTPPKELTSDAEMKAAVAADAAAIGYIDAAAVDGTVKVLAKF
ncbi:phosphate ABC transporter substrate-binding protein [Rheinheimera riviphila]|uniref:Phosphate ABC transporter substrate-binding protein n=1 Tax=Rheinheimera riviphila TaxID=1834037 RepID=A0A437R4W6_9GAMM|nr:phosphate ABC transporter substrate-binding protein [Rheinheimera riviphila]RVU41816.1 phosphate ABC transporter substrate-binding protein [Rheinheimera riviphila]